MKNALSTFIILLFILNANAQKSDSTILRTRELSNGNLEISTRLKSSKDIKNGLAQVKIKDRIVAEGIYKEDIKIGEWKFYKKDTIEQIYDYSKKQVVFNNPDSSIRVFFTQASVKDSLTLPIKIGGIGHGVSDLYKVILRSMKFEEGDYELFITISVNPQGKPAKIICELPTSKLNKAFELTLADLDLKEIEFIPAKINGKNASSIFRYRVSLKMWGM